MAKSGFANELEALGTVLGALEPLDEEQRQFVLRTAINRLGVAAAVDNTGPAAAGGRGTARAGGDGSAELARTTPKEFMRNRQPITDVQRVACLAYYLARARDASQFKTLDLTKLNTEAACAKFSNAAVAVNNATLTGLLASAGGGKKQITALGEDVVEALPDQEQAKLALANAKKNRRRRKKKTAKKS